MLHIALVINNVIIARITWSVMLQVNDGLIYKDVDYIVTAVGHNMDRGEIAVSIERI